jgi:hypothetical protein
MMAVYAQRSHNLVPSLRIEVRAMGCNSSIWTANTCGVDGRGMLVGSCATVIRHRHHDMVVLQVAHRNVLCGCSFPATRPLFPLSFLPLDAVEAIRDLGI